MPSHSSLQRRLVTLRQPDNVAPSLHSHYKSFHATMGSAALLYLRVRRELISMPIFIESSEVSRSIASRGKNPAVPKKLATQALAGQIDQHRLCWLRIFARTTV